MAHDSATALIAAATTNHSFHIGPWIIVPLLLLAVVIATPIYMISDRRKRRSSGQSGRR
jgi:hypothetical protein